MPSAMTPPLISLDRPVAPVPRRHAVTIKEQPVITPMQPRPGLVTVEAAVPIPRDVVQ